MDLAKLAAKILDAKKGADIRLLDVGSISKVADYMLVVSGSSPPHLKALSNEVVHALKEKGVPCYRKAGTPESGWMVLDYVDVIIHIFSPAARQYYGVEALWAKARLLE